MAHDHPTRPLPARSRQAQARLLLDARLAPLRDLHLRTPLGWARTSRETLGMSTGALARRTGVTARRVLQVEYDERRGHVQLATLTRFAEALGCRVVCAFVPHTSCHDMVLD